MKRGIEYAWTGDKELDTLVTFARLNLQLAEAKAKVKADTASRAQVAKATVKRYPVRIGMTTQEVLETGWGKPMHLNRTTTAAGTREPWVYPRYRSYLYFTDGILTSVQN